MCSLIIILTVSLNNKIYNNQSAHRKFFSLLRAILFIRRLDAMQMQFSVNIVGAQSRR